MRSLIILEVEHGDTTDDLERFIASISTTDVIINDYTVRVDLPACFVLDSDNTNKNEGN